MAFQRVPFTYEVVVSWTMNGVPCINTFYVRVDEGDYSQTTAEDIAAAVDQWVFDYLKLAWGSSTVYTSTTVRGLNAAEDYYAQDATNTGVVGTYTTGVPLPNNAAFSVTRNTGLTGRSARGRVYLPLHAAMLTTDENVVAVAWYEVVKDSLDAFRAEVAAAVASAEEVVVSRYTGGALRSEAVTRPVTAYAASDLTVDTQRRRLV